MQDTAFYSSSSVNDRQTLIKYVQMLTKENKIFAGHLMVLQEEHGQQTKILDQTLQEMQEQQVKFQFRLQECWNRFERMNSSKIEMQNMMIETLKENKKVKEEIAMVTKKVIQLDEGLATCLIEEKISGVALGKSHKEMPHDSKMDGLNERESIPLRAGVMDHDNNNGNANEKVLDELDEKKREETNISCSSPLEDALLSLEGNLSQVSQQLLRLRSDCQKHVQTDKFQDDTYKSGLIEKEYVPKEMTIINSPVVSSTSSPSDVTGRSESPSELEMMLSLCDFLISKTRKMKHELR